MADTSNGMPNSPYPPVKPSLIEIKDAINRIESFSPAPRILARAMVLMRDAECDLGSVATLIRGDPALASGIIRVSNSVYFGGKRQAESVEDALQTIGFNEALRLLNLTVSRIVASENLDSYCISAEDYWAESLFHGLFMEQLAKATGGAEPSEAYTCGLLRYIGRLAINRGIQICGGGLFWLGTEQVTEWELENVGFTQSQAGAILLTRWNFPHKLIIACSGQDRPALLSSPSWLANALFFVSSALPQGFDEPFNPVLAPISDSAFLHPNGLTVEAVETIFMRTQESYLKIRESLS